MRSDGVQRPLRLAGAHEQEEALGELGAHAASRRRDALSSADHQVGQQGETLAVALAKIVGLQDDGEILCEHRKLQNVNVCTWMSIEAACVMLIKREKQHLIHRQKKGINFPFIRSAKF